jgi:replication factor A1
MAVQPYASSHTHTHTHLGGLGSGADVLGVLKERGELGSVTVKSTQAKVSACAPRCWSPRPTMPDAPAQLPKRDLVLYDASQKEVRVTLWSALAETFGAEAGALVAIKNAKVSEYNGGRTLSTLQTSSVVVNPDLPEAARLRAWLQGEGATAITTTLSATSPGGAGGADEDVRKEIGRIEPDKVGGGVAQVGVVCPYSPPQYGGPQVGMGDKPDFIGIRGTVLFIPSEKATYYTAAPDTGAKVVQVRGRSRAWACLRPRGSPRMTAGRTRMASGTAKRRKRHTIRATTATFCAPAWATIAARPGSTVALPRWYGATARMWADAGCVGVGVGRAAFNDTALQMMSLPASELAKYKEAGRADAYTAAFLAANFHSYVFRVRSKAETYNDETRVRHNIISIKPVRHTRPAHAWCAQGTGELTRSPGSAADRVCARVQGHSEGHPHVRSVTGSGRTVYILSKHLIVSNAC